jgi:hypothetical protein
LILIILRWSISDHECFAIDLRTNDACHCVTNAIRLRKKHDSEMWRKRCMKHLNNRCILSFQVWLTINMLSLYFNRKRNIRNN